MQPTDLARGMTPPITATLRPRLHGDGARFAAESVAEERRNGDHDRSAQEGFRGRYSVPSAEGGLFENDRRLLSQRSALRAQRDGNGLAAAQGANGVAARAFAIITHNVRDFDAVARFGVRVLAPAQFLLQPSRR